MESMEHPHGFVGNSQIIPEQRVIQIKDDGTKQPYLFLSIHVYTAHSKAKAQKKQEESMGMERRNGKAKKSASLCLRTTFHFKGTQKRV